MQARQRSGHVFLLYTRIHTHIIIYIYYLDFLLYIRDTPKRPKRQNTSSPEKRNHKQLHIQNSCFVYVHFCFWNISQSMLNDALSSFCPTGQKSCEIRRTNWYQQICGYHLFFLKKLHQTKHRFSCAYFLGGLYQVHIVLTSHQTFHHQGDFAFRNARSFLGHFAFKLKFFSVPFLRVSAAKVNVNCRFLFFVHFCFWNISEC